MSASTQEIEEKREREEELEDAIIESEFREFEKFIKYSRKEKRY